MRKPSDLLVGDVAADSFHIEALMSLGSIGPLSPGVQSLASAVILLVQDRAARIALAGVERLEK